MTTPPSTRAADPRTAPSQLGELAHASPALALAVASNPAATPKLLARLARSPDLAVREAVCVHPRTPPRVVYRLAVEMPAIFARTELGRTLFRAGPGGAPRTAVVRRLLAHDPSVWLDALLAHPHPAARVELALRPELPLAAVTRLAADASPSVRRTIARREPLDLRHVATLARDPDAEVRARIAGRGDLTAALVTTLATDADTSVRCAVARRTDLDPALAVELARDAWPWVREALARNPACPEPLLLAFAAEADASLDDAILANPVAPPNALLQVGPRIAARVKHGWMHAQLVQHPRATEEVVAAVLRSASPQVRAELVHRAGPLSFEMMLELAGDPEPRVASALAYRPQLPLEVLLRLFAHPDPLPRGGAVRHPGAPAALIERGASDPDMWLRRCAAENPGTPADLLARLAHDREPLVRADVARHTRDVSLLLYLAKDASEQVLYQVAYNRSTPSVLAQQLRDHPGVRVLSGRW